MWWSQIAAKKAMAAVPAAVAHRQAGLEIPATTSAPAPAVCLGLVQSPLFFTDVAGMLKATDRPASELPAKWQEKASTSLATFKRVLHEMREVNADFHNIRTAIHPDPEDRLNVFYYVLIPNDGAFCHIPLAGRLIIPSGYPASPPVLHMLTLTGRYNVDIFQYAATLRNATGDPWTESSSMCFDILQSAWKPEFTLTTMFASLMQALVSYRVDQQYGEPKAEFVTMELLKQCYASAQAAIKTYHHLLPPIPLIPAVCASPVAAQRLYAPHNKGIFRVGENKRNASFEYSYVFDQSFALHTRQAAGPLTVAFDMSNIPDSYVVSFVITTNTNDLVGKQPGTVLFRSGVTATAASRLPNGKQTVWWYHGKPLNMGNMQLALTIVPNKEIVLAYKDDATLGGWFVMGDTALATLDPKIVGDLSNLRFSLVVYFKRKWGNATLDMPFLDEDTGFARA